MKYAFVIILLWNFHFNVLTAQIDSEKRFSLDFSSGLHAEGTTLKYLFTNSELNEISRGVNSVKIVLGYQMSPNVLFQVGGQFQYARSKFRKQFFFNVDNPDNLFSIENVNESLIPSTYSDLKIRTVTTISKSFREGIDENINGAEYYLTVYSRSSYNSIGIPIQVRIHGAKKRIRPFFQGQVLPEIKVKKITNVSNSSGTGLRLNSNQGRLFPDARKINVELDEGLVEAQDWNLKDFMLSCIGTFGIESIHNKKIFSLGFSFGRSLTPFTIVQNEKHYSFMAGVNLGFRQMLF